MEPGPRPKRGDGRDRRKGERGRKVETDWAGGTAVMETIGEDNAATHRLEGDRRGPEAEAVLGAETRADGVDIEVPPALRPQSLHRLKSNGIPLF